MKFVSVNSTSQQKAKKNCSGLQDKGCTLVLLPRTDFSAPVAFNKASSLHKAQHNHLSLSSMSAIAWVAGTTQAGWKGPSHHVVEMRSWQTPEGKLITHSHTPPHSATLDKACLPDWLHHPHIKPNRFRFSRSIYRPGQSQLQEEPMTEYRTNQHLRTTFRGVGDRWLMNCKVIVTLLEICSTNKLLATHLD